MGANKTFRAHQMRFLNPSRATTRVVFIPQIWFKNTWCCFPDSASNSEIIEYRNKAEALKYAEQMYKLHEEDKS